MNGFGLDHLPYGVVDGHCVVRYGDHVLDLGQVPGLPPVFDHPSLNQFLALGRPIWEQTRERVIDVLERGTATLDAIYEPELPVAVGDYVAGDRDGRAGTIVVSGTPIVRPRGAQELGFALELGFVTGPGRHLGTPIPASEAREHVFGFVLVNDWAARDLEPVLATSFATSMSAWITPLAALEPYLEPDGALAVEHAVTVNGELAANGSTRLEFSAQLAHATAGGACVRPGDLFTAAGAPSGPLQDGDCVVLRGRVGPIELGAVRGELVSGS